MTSRFVVLSAACGLAAATSASGVVAPYFARIPGLPGDNPLASHALGVTGDGSTVFGEVRTTGQWEGMTWTLAGGTVAHGLGTMYGGSQDGSFFVGPRGKWTSSTGWTALPVPAGAAVAMEGQSVSRDGSTIVGSARLSDGRVLAAKWTQSGGAQLLPTVPLLNADPVRATRASSDGSLIAGTASRGFDQGFITSATTASMMPVTGILRDMTSDGRFAVGHSSVVTSAGWIVNLTTNIATQIPPVAGTQSGYAAGISADGSTVVGHSGSNVAYIWDAAHGTRNLATVLTQDYGIDLGGFILGAALDISEDGRTIVGYGINPGSGIEQAWVATIPAPATGAPLALGALAAARRRRRV